MATVKSEGLPKFEAWLDSLPKARTKPVLVCKDGKIVGNAVVRCSPRDPNWYRNRIGGDGIIKVRSR